MRFSDLFGGGGPQKPVEPAPASTAFVELEVRIDRICHALGIDGEQVTARASDTSDLPGYIWEDISAGRLIQAIKSYRELTGCGLKEAKDAVEAARDGAPLAGSPFTILQAKLDAILAKVEAER